MIRLLVIVSAILILPVPALAEMERHNFEVCTCRAKDRRVQLGDTLCLSTPDGPRIAKCIKNQNLTFWSFTKDGCVLSALSRAAAPNL